MEYFLNHSNHRPGTPIDYISYHFYATPSPSQTLADWQYTFFDQADGFLNTVRYVEDIRQRISPLTKTDIDELGVELPTDNKASDNIPPPPAYWNLAGSLYAYLFIHLSQMKIDVIGESQLIGFPSQFPSVSMMDWVTDRPNARFWMLKLIKDNFQTGDKLVNTEVSGDSTAIEAQAFVTASGHKVLLLNKRDKAVRVILPGIEHAHTLAVDESDSEYPAHALQPGIGEITLSPFAVAVATW